MEDMKMDNIEKVYLAACSLIIVSILFFATKRLE